MPYVSKATGQQLAKIAARCMAGQKLAILAEQLLQVGWSVETPVLLVSDAGTRQEQASETTVGRLASAGERHAGRPTIVIVGAGARPVLARDAVVGNLLPPCGASA